MKKVINLDTIFLKTSLELLSGMAEQLDYVGRQSSRAHYYNLLSEKDMKDIHEKIGISMNYFEDLRITLVKELDRRFKESLGASRGPSDVNNTIKKLIELHPCLIYSEENMVNLSKREEKVSRLTPVK